MFSKRQQSSASMTSLEAAKRLAAYQAVNQHIKSGYIVGIGSGSTVIYAVERLAQRVATEKVVVSCVPTSFQARQLLVQNQLTLTDLDVTPNLDVCIDGADEVDSNLDLIKGGGGCLLQEKIVASCARKLIIIADYTKNSSQLGEQYKKGIPIEVAPMAYFPIKTRLEAKYQGQFMLRMAVNKAGPVVTHNGNFILDWTNFDQTLEWKNVNQELALIPGVVETGLFIQMAQEAYFGMPNGSVKVQKRSAANSLPFFSSV
uniref:Ribose-5-phosphate isomerase n=1 Tax=Dendroctonus ponderosae TaxID=77166 RepID=A0AAR5P8C9_DENPD